MKLSDKLKSMHEALGIPIDYMSQRGLPFHEEAGDLEVAGSDPNGLEIPLTSKAASAWRALAAQAAHDKIEIFLESGFRSYDEQAGLIRHELEHGSSLEKALSWIAAPGFSEHHSGRAVDIACPGHFPVTQDFHNTDAFRWLERNAGTHGFTLSYPGNNPFGIIYEPWHWCWHES